MYVHSWQSYIWNQVVSERIKLHGCDKPVVGDLVLIGEDTEDKEAVDEEADMPAAPPVEALDPDLDAGEVCSVLSQSCMALTPSVRPIAYAAAEPAPTANPASSALNLDRALATSRAPKARVLTQEDIDAGTHTIFDVVLPMPGYATVYPEGQLGERYKAIMRADGIDPDNMFRKQKEYSLVSRLIAVSDSVDGSDFSPCRMCYFRAAPIARLCIWLPTSRTACLSINLPTTTSLSPTKTFCSVAPRPRSYLTTRLQCPGRWTRTQVMSRFRSK